MIGPCGPDLYWLRLGPVEMTPLLQAYIHVRISLADRLRVIYTAHELLRRPNPKAQWQQGETIRMPLDLAARAQITILLMTALWELVISDLSLESLADLQLQASESGPVPALTLLPPGAETDLETGRDILAG